MGTNHTELLNNYYDWLLTPIKAINWYEFSKLYECLHRIKFKWTCSSDASRAKDGIRLRYDYVYENNLTDYEYDILNEELGKASILEVMVALALHCESIKSNEEKYGNRTVQWFNAMIRSLGLNGMINDYYNESRVREIIRRFLNKDYAPDGKGGLFWIHRFKGDLREENIWTQMCWYLDSMP